MRFKTLPSAVVTMPRIWETMSNDPFVFRKSS
jgi:hypothetical protein